MKTKLLTALAIAALAGCQPSRPPAHEEELSAGETMVASAADPCKGRVPGAFGKALCADPALAPLLGQVRQELLDAADLISTDGAEELARGQEQWFEATRVSCGVTAGARAVEPKQQACIADALNARLKAASEAVRTLGGYTFQTIEVTRAQKPEGPQALDARTAEPPILVELRYPRIDGDTPQIRKFNELMEQKPQFTAADRTAEQTSYEVAYAGPDLVSVKFSSFNMTIGAAHPDSSEKAVTVVMATGEPLTPSDVFAAPEAEWSAAIVDVAHKELKKQFREAGFDPAQLTRDQVADTATKPHNWLVEEDALVLLFPPYSIGPYALGALEVRVPWKNLGPLLNPIAPAPIKRTEG
jgi:hypothetical protein